MLEAYKFDKPKKASPSFLRDFYRNGGGRRETLARDDGLFMLEYLNEDLGEGEKGQLKGIRLLPLMDGSWGFFDDCQSDNPLYVVNSTQKSLLKSVPSLVVDNSTESEVVNALLVSKGVLEATNVTKLGLSDFRTLLDQVVPLDWHGLTEISWNPEQESVVTEEWIASFWSYVVTAGEDEDGGGEGEVESRLAMFLDSHPLLPCFVGDNGERVLCN